MNKDNLSVEKLKASYFKLYGAYGASEADFQQLMQVVEEAKLLRPNKLKKFDSGDPHWYQSEKMVGMMLYVDLFSGDLLSLIDKIPYLQELGITYVHLMPLLKPRKGENDGGYAVEDYEDIDPRLGTVKEFKKVIDAFFDAHIYICIDYVLNHTADTHEWAVKALAGDGYYQKYYEMYDNRVIPDQYDPYIPEVLPDKHPGNFTYYEGIDKWVFTSFSDFQWDLNFKNPNVFREMVQIMLDLANWGITILRLDAIAFLWKEVGTSCRNLPKAHDVLKLLHLIKEFACPSLALLGEAIVEPHEIIKYYGSQGQEECGLLYNATFMVNIFNALATRDTRLMHIDNNRFHVPPYGCFMNYVRCHDDIGWGFNEEATQYLGMNPFDHKQFLIHFYAGDYEGSFAKGQRYQYNPKNQDARINGTLASLLGLEKAVAEKDLRGRMEALHRIQLVTALIFAYRGIPLIYSGDEIATLNDDSYLKDPDKMKEDRWMHRPIFNWKRAKKRSDPLTAEGIIFGFTQKVIKIRKSNPIFSGEIEAKPVHIKNQHVYGFYKESESDLLIALFNFHENHQGIQVDDPYLWGDYKDLLTGRRITIDGGYLQMYGYEALWLKKCL